MKRALRRIQQIDWPLLLLLTVVANQGIIWLKFAGLLGVFVLRPQLRGMFRKGRLPLFIPLLLLLGSLNFFLLVRDFSTPSLAAWAVSMAFWGAAFLGTHQVRLSLERAPTKTVPTLRLFVLLNVALSLGQLIHAAWINGVWNPYKDLPFPYGMSTGDLLAGVFWEGGYNNAFVNVLLVVFFLFRRDWGYATLCLLVLLLIFGNAMLLSIIVVLGLMALCGLLPSRLRPAGWRLFPASRVAIAALLGAFSLVVMLGWVSPENVRYIAANTTEKKLVETPVVQQRPEALQPSQPSQPLPAAVEPPSLRRLVRTLDFKKYQSDGCRPDTADTRLRREVTEYAIKNLNGKKLSFLETFVYLQANPQALLVGAGPARFSSLTAARLSGLDSSRIFTRLLPRFATCAYRENHRLIHEVRVSGDPAWLSTTNWPNSFYNVLLGDYGLAGLLLFLAFYVWRYARRLRRLSYGFWASVLLVPIALLTYLVEPLCVLFFYELLMEKDLADSSQNLSV